MSKSQLQKCSDFVVRIPNSLDAYFDFVARIKNIVAEETGFTVCDHCIDQHYSRDQNGELIVFNGWKFTVFQEVNKIAKCAVREVYFMLTSMGVFVKAADDVSPNTVNIIKNTFLKALKEADGAL